MDFITDLNYYLVLTSLLIIKKESKTFEDKLVKHTQDNVNVSIRSFDKFLNILQRIKLISNIRWKTNKISLKKIQKQKIS
jgi:hypothetical protein